jgi:serine/threonine kinase 32
LGNNGAAEVKNHPWLKNFPWKDLEEKKIDAPFIPPLEDNFDTRNINEEWKDLDDPEFKENITNLRRNSIQELFNGYYFDYQLAAIAA